MRPPQQPVHDAGWANFVPPGTTMVLGRYSIASALKGGRRANPSVRVRGSFDAAHNPYLPRDFSCLRALLSVDVDR